MTKNDHFLEGPVFVISHSWLVFHGLRLVFHVFFMVPGEFLCFSWFQVGFYGYWWVFMVFLGPGLVFMVTGGFSWFFMVPCWFFMVPGWFFMVFLQNVPG